MRSRSHVRLASFPLETNDLFSSPEDPAAAPAPDARAPLATRMRPRTLDEYVGQEHLLGPGKILRRAIEADRLSSALFHGPPGTGKTSLAEVIAHATRSKFERLNGVESTVADIRRVIATAENRQRLNPNVRTVFSSTKSTASTARSRTPFCPTWNAARSGCSARRRKTRTSP